MANIAVYITGSIAAYKAITVIRELQRAGHQIRVAMTAAAKRFIGPATLEGLIHWPVVSDLWASQGGRIPHIELADWSELAVVVPASADLLAKMAQGIADDVVSAALLATVAPRVVIPAMNSHMWSNPATQRNLSRLEADGVIVMEPVKGPLAEGYVGYGRLPEPQEIIKFLISLPISKGGTLVGRRLVVTAGGTLEPIDPARFLGNYSSGRMGIAIAIAAARQGAQVDLIVGQVTVPLPMSPRIHCSRVRTTEELLNAVDNAFNKADGLVMAAAVADFRLAKVNSQKLKRNHQGEVTLNLIPTPDILSMMGAKKGKRLVIGFAAETDHLITNAHEELIRKHADIIVANDISQPGSGFGVDTDQVTILRTGHEPESWPQLPKTTIATRLVDMISCYFE